jgi:hypothetical protein
MDAFNFYKDSGPKEAQREFPTHHPFTARPLLPTESPKTSGNAPTTSIWRFTSFFRRSEIDALDAGLMFLQQGHAGEQIPFGFGQGSGCPG